MRSKTVICGLLGGLFLCLGAGCTAPSDGDGSANGNQDGAANNGGDSNGDGSGTGTTPAPQLFALSDDCAACHNELMDKEGNDVSIETSWRATMMANAARDPYFLAKVSAEIDRFPALRSVIEDTCARCHMPMAHTQLAADGASGAIFGEGFLDREHPLHELALDGVSCTLCHQVEEAGLGQEQSFSGGYQIDLVTPPPDRVTYGPFANPDSEIMQTVSGFVPEQGEHLSDSALCATCHTLFTPTVNAAGEVVGTFPEQVPFLEWRHSAYSEGGENGRSCQDCHMPDADGAVVIATIPGDTEARAPFARHHFVGGNALMLRILKAHREELNVEASPADFDAVISRVLDQLRNNAGSLSITSADRSGTSLRVALRVQNLAGHKVPTGFPARQLWLHLSVFDGAGTTVFESGAPQADGSIAGNDLDGAVPVVEPHHQLINDPGQVQIYEAVLEGLDGEVTFTLLKAAGYAKDNRLLPAGFDKQTAAPEFAPTNDAATDEQFIGGSHELTYVVEVGEAEGPFQVTAELLYQSVSSAFVNDLRGTETDMATRFVGYFDEADKTPTVIANADVTIP